MKKKVSHLMDSSDDEPGHLVIQVPGNLLKVDNDHDVDDGDDGDR